MNRVRINREHPGNRRTRRLALSLLVIAVVLGFLAIGGSPANATCGDYLSQHAIQSQHAMQSRQAMQTDGDHGVGRSTVPRGLLNLVSSRKILFGERLPLRIPCHGPSCQQGPVSLPLSTPIDSVETQDRWGWTAIVSIASLEQTSSLAPIEAPVALPMIAFRIDRPPKA